MTIASKINTLVITVMVVLGCLVTAFITQHEYRGEHERILKDAAAKLLGQPDLQLHIYYRDKEKLTEALGGFLEAPAVSYAVIHEGNGDIVLAREQDGEFGHKWPSVKILRSGLTPLQQGLLYIETEKAPTRLDWLAWLLGGDQITHLTLPVMSVVNPNFPGLSPADFATAMTKPHSVDSVHVIAYVHLGISRIALMMDIMPFVVHTVLTCLVVVGLCSLLIIRTTRRITAPLSRLARAADQMASGKLQEPVPIRGSGEIKEIATILNGLLGGISTYKSKMDVDHQLLSMKVEERTSQLSRRDEELNKAVEEVTQTKDQLRQMAYYDSLTALPNRRLFTEELNLLMRLAKRNEQNLALLFLDLDNFKRINDSLGHSAGDLLLREVGNRLVSCVRESDVVAHYVESGAKIDVSRLGGDEFTVVLNQIESPEAAAVAARRLIQALIEPMTIDNHELVVTPSIGIALAPQDATDVEGLLRAADTAMYHAKASGKNSFMFYHKDMDATNIARLQLETDLRKAIERKQLVLHYQPQVNTETGTVVGAEALVRWEHPEQGLIPPFKFIPLAEEIGLIGEMGDWVLVEACRQMKEFEREGLWLPKMSVNVSALQFNPTFIRRVREVLLQIGLAPSALSLELTEGVMLDDVGATIEALRELKAMGVGLSIDDFGTGYSSLNYLNILPVDELKIDRSFIDEIPDNAKRNAIVATIIYLSESLGIQTVAEGVENDSQLQFLKKNRCHQYQGYLFSQPLTNTELLTLIHK